MKLETETHQITLTSETHDDAVALSTLFGLLPKETDCEYKLTGLNDRRCLVIETDTPWVPVDEQLPPPHTDVHTYNNRRHSIGAHRLVEIVGKRWWYGSNWDGRWPVEEGAITHWRPYPGPPVVPQVEEGQPKE